MTTRILHADLLLVAVALTGLLAFGCTEANTGNPEPAETTEATETTDGAEGAAETPGNQDAAESAGEAVQDEVPAVMNQPLDGTSVEAFDAGLARVETEAGPVAARRVNDAVAYLLMYEVGARGNREQLYLKLNGKTPNEIIEMVKARR